jgi:ferredoxin
MVSVRIDLDRSVCTGHGRCYALVPDLFEPDDAGNGTVRHEVVDTAADRAAASTAADNCPEQAITLTEQD